MTPDVTIIVPVHNDEDYIAAALESCLAQTSESFEVICVDDASSDSTVQVIEGFQGYDQRIRLIRQDRNRSAFQARRVGIEAARAPFVLFLDGDDELAPEAIETTLQIAAAEEADVVGFGVEVVTPDGETGGRFEQTLQPTHRTLERQEILTTLFPVGKTAQGHIWKYLWSTDLLRAAYAGVPESLELYRANDIPIAFLSLASATKYVSTSEKLLRYYWRRGTSGHAVQDRESFEFYLSGLTSIDSIRARVEEIDALVTESGPVTVKDTYESARLSILGNLLRYWLGIASDELRHETLMLLGERAGRVDVVRAAATFAVDALPMLTKHREVFASSSRHPVRSVLLTATNLDHGGAQGVVVSQAEHLVKAGFAVVIGVRNEPVSVYDLPPEVTLVSISGDMLADRINRYLEVCDEFNVDVAIDHWTLYRDDWPFIALAALTVGVRTIGWLHNFALRPLFDGNRRISFLTDHLPLLWKVVTLSETDVAFWKLRGIENPVYLPNPPSPFLLDYPARSTPRELSDGPIRLVWWGRLQQSTKRIRELVSVAAELRALGVDFKLTIIGPDSRDLTAASLAKLADELGIGDSVSLPGPMGGATLHAALDEHDLYVGTSAIEGYPLTLVEAQSLGLPLALYELPWLAALRENGGVLSVPQYDKTGLAQEIADLSRDPSRYRALSEASIAAAHSVLAHDFTQLYAQLLTDSLPAENSPNPTARDAQVLLERAVAYAEQNVRWARRNEEALRSRVRELNSQVGALRQTESNLAHQVGGLTQGFGTLHEENQNLERDNSRLSRRAEKLQQSNELLRKRIETLRKSNDDLAENARVRRAKNFGLSRLRRKDQAKIAELREQIAELKRQTSK